MNDTCDACGSHRMLLGKLGGVPDEHGRHHGYECPAGFVCSGIEQPPFWKPILAYPRHVAIRQHGVAGLCLDCGTVSVSLTADVKAARKVVDKWGSDALKPRAEGDEQAG